MKVRKFSNGFKGVRCNSSHLDVSYGDFKPLLMNIDERVKPSELGCGDPTLGCRELWMTAFIQ